MATNGTKSLSTTMMALGLSILAMFIGVYALRIIGVSTGRWYPNLQGAIIGTAFISSFYWRLAVGAKSGRRPNLALAGLASLAAGIMSLGLYDGGHPWVAIARWIGVFVLLLTLFLTGRRLRSANAGVATALET